MILVISETADISTDYFMEWTDYFKISVLRINSENAANILSYFVLSNGGSQLSLRVADKTICLEDIDAVWFRRGYIKHYSSIQLNDECKALDDSICRFLDNENRTLDEFILYSIEKKYTIGSQRFYNANKLIALSVAADVGFNIPKTLITKQLAEVKTILGSVPVVTKAIQDAWAVEQNGIRFSPVVNKIDNTKMFDEFYYSKFQVEVKKKYELRVFFMGEQFYTAAIFPTNKVNSKIVENEQRYPRVIPFNLPTEYKNKLKQFNKIMRLNTGSFDIIVDKEDKFYFLEVNPVGQYDYVSKLCNYYLDKKIAIHFQDAIANEKK